MAKTENDKENWDLSAIKGHWYTDYFPPVKKEKIQFNDKGIKESIS
jgi:hypothetical protein